MYGDLTARGMAGGRAGEKVDCARENPIRDSKAVATCWGFIVINLKLNSSDEQL